MPTFHYTARSRGGEIVRGTMEAATDAEVRERLSASRYHLMDVAASPRDIAPAPGARPMTVEGFLAGLPAVVETPEVRYEEPIPEPGGRKGVIVPTRALAVFYRKMAVMLRSGVPVFQVVHGFRLQTRNPTLARALLDMEAAALHGRPLSEAMARHPRAFRRGHVGLVRVGERSGRLAATFEALADQMDADWGVEISIRWNPLFFIVRWFLTPVLVIFFLALFPANAGLTAGQPGMAVVRVVVALAMLAMVLMLIYPVLLAGLRRVPGGGKLLDCIARLPIVGARGSRIERVHTLSALVAGLEAGVPLSQAWDLTVDAAESDRSRAAMMAQGGRIRRGEAVSEALAATGLYDETVVQAARYGEYTGNLPQSLKEIIAYDRKEAALLGDLTPWVLATIAYFLYLLVASYLVLRGHGI